MTMFLRNLQMSINRFRRKEYAVISRVNEG